MATSPQELTNQIKQTRDVVVALLRQAQVAETVLAVHSAQKFDELMGTAEAPVVDSVVVGPDGKIIGTDILAKDYLALLPLMVRLTTVVKMEQAMLLRIAGTLLIY